MTTAAQKRETIEEIREREDRAYTEIFTLEVLSKIPDSRPPDAHSSDAQLLLKIPDGVVWDKQHELLKARILRCLRHPLRDDFLHQLEWMTNNHREDRTYTVELGMDFAPLSFSFAYLKDGKAWMHGGLIFHLGGLDFDSPQFCVSLGSKIGWSAHT